ncbi:hypothetical protein DPMN_000485 [Dreissena polymorpha]|uniref:Uncharacterized protein n=1 Tax=Dreissena polymorpha TaxID=45954 RepID=A0A9D4MFF8_DREPO|nr:hypothetical protein DPMN_000485 [Dreissena polymorpha]
MNTWEVIVVEKLYEGCIKCTLIPPARQPASQPASQPARIRQSNNQFFPSENLVKNCELIPDDLAKNFQHQPKSHRSTHIRKNDPPLAFITTVLTKFYKDWTKNVTSIVKNAQPQCSHVFQRTETIFEHSPDIIRTNVLTQFHDDWTKNVTSTRVLTFYIAI